MRVNRDDIQTIVTVMKGLDKEEIKGLSQVERRAVLAMTSALNDPKNKNNSELTIQIDDKVFKDLTSKANYSIDFEKAIKNTGLYQVFSSFFKGIANIFGRIPSKKVFTEIETNNERIKISSVELSDLKQMRGYMRTFEQDSKKIIDNLTSLETKAKKAKKSEVPLLEKDLNNLIEHIGKTKDALDNQANKLIKMFKNYPSLDKAFLNSPEAKILDKFQKELSKANLHSFAEIKANFANALQFFKIMHSFVLSKVE